MLLFCKSVKNCVVVFSLLNFILSTLLLNNVFAQDLMAGLDLPMPGELMARSSDYSSAVLLGIKVDPQNPLKLKFIVDTANQEKVTKAQAKTLVNYFMAALTTPNESLWVNLSPYERDRVIELNLGITEMGRDMLAQDYVLKQLSSSLTHPATPLGNAYWNRVSSEETGDSIDTFNKIWIVPEQAKIKEENGLALITKSSLKVMNDSDYLAIAKNDLNVGQNLASSRNDINHDLILPEITREVNQGKNFAQLRQIYNSIILATWFKKKFSDTLYKNYLDKSLIRGIGLEDKKVKDKIFNLYVEAFKKGAYDLVRKELDQSKRKIKRHYFSGGANLNVDPKVANSAIESSDIKNVAKGKLKYLSAELEALFGIEPDSQQDDNYLRLMQLLDEDKYLKRYIEKDNKSNVDQYGLGIMYTNLADPAVLNLLLAVEKQLSKEQKDLILAYLVGDSWQGTFKGQLLSYLHFNQDSSYDAYKSLLFRAGVVKTKINKVLEKYNLSQTELIDKINASLSISIDYVPIKKNIKILVDSGVDELAANDIFEEILQVVLELNTSFYVAREIENSGAYDVTQWKNMPLRTLNMSDRYGAWVSEELEKTLVDQNYNSYNLKLVELLNGKKVPFEYYKFILANLYNAFAEGNQLMTYRTFQNVLRGSDHARAQEFLAKYGFLDNEQNLLPFIKEIFESSLELVDSKVVFSTPNLSQDTVVAKTVVESDIDEVAEPKPEAKPEIESVKEINEPKKELNDNSLQSSEIDSAIEVIESLVDENESSQVLEENVESETVLQEEDDLIPETSLEDEKTSIDSNTKIDDSEKYELQNLDEYFATVTSLLQNKKQIDDMSIQNYSKTQMSMNRNSNRLTEFLMEYDEYSDADDPKELSPLISMLAFLELNSFYEKFERSSYLDAELRLSILRGEFKAIRGAQYFELTPMHWDLIKDNPSDKLWQIFLRRLRTLKKNNKTFLICMMEKIVYFDYESYADEIDLNFLKEISRFFEGDEIKEFSVKDTVSLAANKELAHSFYKSVLIVLEGLSKSLNEIKKYKNIQKAAYKYIANYDELKSKRSEYVYSERELNRKYINKYKSNEFISTVEPQKLRSLDFISSHPELFSRVLADLKHDVYRLDELFEEIGDLENFRGWTYMLDPEDKYSSKEEKLYNFYLTQEFEDISLNFRQRIVDAGIFYEIILKYLKSLNEMKVIPNLYGIADLLNRTLIDRFTNNKDPYLHNFNQYKADSKDTIIEGMHNQHVYNYCVTKLANITHALLSEYSSYPPVELELPIWLENFDRSIFKLRNGDLVTETNLTVAEWELTALLKNYGKDVFTDYLKKINGLEISEASELKIKLSALGNNEVTANIARNGGLNHVDAIAKVTDAYWTKYDNASSSIQLKRGNDLVKSTIEGGLNLRSVEQGLDILKNDEFMEGSHITDLNLEGLQGFEVQISDLRSITSKDALYI